MEAKTLCSKYGHIAYQYMIIFLVLLMTIVARTCLTRFVLAFDLVHRYTLLVGAVYCGYKLFLAAGAGPRL